MLDEEIWDAVRVEVRAVCRTLQMIHSSLGRLCLHGASPFVPRSIVMLDLLASNAAAVV